MANKIDLKKCVETFNQMTNEDNKRKYIEKVVYRKYVPFGEKYMVLKGMLDKSTYTNDNGIKYINMISFKIDYMLAIVLMYTNIELLRDGDGKIKAFESYDMLVESNILSYLISQIGSNEISEIDDINKSLIDTFENEHNNIANYIMTQINSIMDILGQRLNDGANKLNETLNDKDKLISIKKQFEDIYRKIKK